MIEKIREGVAQVRSEIDLLREYRTRLIADVVTGKLDVREAASVLPEEPGMRDTVLDKTKAAPQTERRSQR